MPPHPAPFWGPGKERGQDSGVQSGQPPQRPASLDELIVLCPELGERFSGCLLWEDFLSQSWFGRTQQGCPSSEPLAGTRGNPKRHRPCILMLWSEGGRKSNNCLHAKTMDLLYEIFILGADPCSVGWDCGAEVSGCLQALTQSETEIYRKGRRKAP